MKNIHILPTDKPSRLIYNDANQLCYQSNKSFKNDRKWMYRKNFNIYITNDEDIKEGDWILNPTNEVQTCIGLEKGIGTDNICWIKVKETTTLQQIRNSQKIILTTDQDLIKDGVQAIDNDFLEWFVKNSSCEEVEIGEGVRYEDEWIDNENGGEIFQHQYCCYKIIIPSSEIWKDIPEFEGYYQISNLGNVRSLNYDKIRELKPRLVGYDGNQYLAVNLSKENKVKSVKVHKLVALCFLNHTSKGYDGLVIDHIDSNKLNNRLDNLKLVTPRFNASKDKQGSSSKFTGVTWHKKSKKWQCQIYDNGKLNHLGLFNTEIEASKTYNNYLENMTKEEPKQYPKTFKELFANTGIEPTTDENGNIQYNFKATIKEEPQQETLEEAAFRLFPRLINDPYNPMEDDNKQERDIWISGAKWQQEQDKNKYSEEEVESIWKFALYSAEQHDKFGTENKSYFIRKDVEEFIEQFKKK